MKKKQMLYIGLGLLIVFVFMLVSVNSRSYNKSYRGYSFGNSLAKTSASAKEGFLNSSPVNPPVSTQTGGWQIQDYLDDPRGPDCSSKSFGITASGGPVCLTENQTRAMSSRGFNTDDSGSGMF